MCSATTLVQQDARVLSVDEIVDLVERCKCLGLVHVDLTGGEPSEPVNDFGTLDERI